MELIASLLYCDTNVQQMLPIRWDSVLSITISPQNQYLYQSNNVWRVLFSEFLSLSLCKRWHIWACLSSIWESIFDLIEVFFELYTREKFRKWKILGLTSDLERIGCSWLICDFCGQWACQMVLYLVWTENSSPCMCPCWRRTVWFWARPWSDVSFFCLSTSFIHCPCFTVLLSLWNLLHHKHSNQGETMIEY